MTAALRVVELECGRQIVGRLDQQGRSEIAIVVIKEVPARRVDIFHIAVGLLIGAGQSQAHLVA